MIYSLVISISQNTVNLEVVGTHENVRTDTQILLPTGNWDNGTNIAQEVSLQMSSKYVHNSYLFWSLLQIVFTNLISICSLNVLTSWSRNLFIASGFLPFCCSAKLAQREWGHFVFTLDQ